MSITSTPFVSQIYAKYEPLGDKLNAPQFSISDFQITELWLRWDTTSEDDSS